MNYSVTNSLNSARSLSAADKQMLFQERMSSTAHEREIEDLKRAGLNPVLSAGGSGASTPTGALDSEEYSSSNPIYGLIKTVNSITNSTSRSLSQATKALSKNLKDLNDTVNEKEAEEDAQNYIKLLSVLPMDVDMNSHSRFSNYGLKPEQISKLKDRYYKKNVDYSFLDKKTGDWYSRNPLELQNLFSIVSSAGFLPSVASLAKGNPAGVAGVLFTLRNILTHPNTVKQNNMLKMKQGRDVNVTANDMAKWLKTNGNNLMGVSVGSSAYSRKGPSKKSSSSATSHRSGGSYRRYTK